MLIKKKKKKKIQTNKKRKKMKAKKTKQKKSHGKCFNVNHPFIMLINRNLYKDLSWVYFLILRYL